MKHKCLFLILWTGIILLLTASFALCAPIGKVTYVEGRVDVLKTGKNIVEPVKAGDLVNVGDIYRTKTKSLAEITFNNQNVLKIAPSTRIEIKEYHVTEDTSSQVMKLHRGRVQAISGEEFIKKVSALAEKNKLEVHTPNAVAGIRGSNMLVGYTQGTTVVIFIAGQGYLYNPQLPQVFVPITAGNMSVVSGEAAPSVPTKAPESLIKGGGEAFIQVQTVKSEEKAAENEVLTTSTTTTETKKEPVPQEGPPVVTTSFAEKEPPPPIPPAPPAPKGTNFTGTASFLASEGPFTANIPDAGTGTMSASINTNNVPSLIEGWLLGTSDKGGAFSGPLAGIQGSWLTRMSALYVEGGYLYFLTGEAPGAFDGSRFTISGSLGKSSSVGTINLTPSPTLLDALEHAIKYATTPLFFPYNNPITISDSGIQLTSIHFGRTAPYLITNEGKKASSIGNIYTGTLNNTAQPSLPYLGYIANNEFALGPLFYTHDTLNKRFTIDTLLSSIRYDVDTEVWYIGTYSMRYLGKYESSSFRMAGTGTYEGTPAHFFGYFGGDSLYYNNNGVMEYAGFEPGLFGGTTDPWTSPADFIAIGNYNLNTTYNKSHYLMNSNISGGTTEVNNDGGHIYGFAGAIWKGGDASTVGTISDGTVRALYISPPDSEEKVTTGIMKGTFTGSYYEISPNPMWGLSGTLTPTQLASSVDPLSVFFAYGQMDGKLTGSFGGSGSIFGSDSGYSSVMFLVSESQPMSFGVFDLKLGNSDSPNTYLGKPTGDTSWSATLGGEGDFDSSNKGYWLASASGTWTATGEITGNVTGKAITPFRLYDMEGKFLGVNSESGTWIGQAIGSYTGTPLSFSGDVSGGLLYYNTDYESLVYANSDPSSTTHNVTGILGGIGNLWSLGSAQLYMMGTYSDKALSPYSGKPRLAYGSGWYLYYDPTIWTGTSTIGGAFIGYNVGLWKDSAINTEALVIYIDPSKNAGYAGGNLTGKYYSYPDMWELSGTLTRTFVETTDILPENLFTSLDQNNLSGLVAGRFTPSGGTIPTSHLEGATIGLTGHTWGIWNLGMGGTYTTPVTSTQVFDFGGEYYYDLDWGYFLGHATTATTSSDTFSGTLNNTKVLTPHFLATMSGNIYGTIDTELATWQAAGVGKWQATPLTSSLRFSTSYSQPTSLWRALPGTYYEAEFTQYISTPYMPQGYYEYDFSYIKTDAKGIGQLKDDYAFSTEKNYFPNNTMYIQQQDGSFYVANHWDILSIEEISALPSWMDPNNPSFMPDGYSKWLSFIDVLENRPNDSLSAIAGMTGYPWNAQGASVSIIGRYNAYGYFTKPTILTTPMLFGTFYTPYVEGGTKNGAYGVTVAGFIADDARGVQLAMRGLYVGPDNQTAGVLWQSQLLSGNFYKDIGMWDAEGTLAARVMNSNFSSNPEGVTIDNFSSNIVEKPIMTYIFGQFSGDSGSFLGQPFVNSGSTRNIKGQDWGILGATIWASGFGVTSTTLPDTWIAGIGAEGYFGEFKNANNQWQPDLGLMLVPTLQGTLSGGVIKARTESAVNVGQFMTMTKMGTISDVGILGVYQQPSPVVSYTAYSWQGVMGGVWNTTQYFTFASHFDSSTKRFTEQHSGNYYTGGETGYNQYQYWFNNEAKYGAINFFSDANKTSITQRKYEPDTGPFSTPMWSEYTYQKSNNTFSEYQTGTDYPDTFSHEFFSNLAQSKGYQAPNHTFDGWGFDDIGSISAIMGGVGDLWGATSNSPATLYFLGEYDKWYEKPVIFLTDIASNNVKNNTNTTLDGQGAYNGYIAGFEADGSIDGGIRAIYLKRIDDTKSQAGFLVGTFTGTVYDDIGMWQGDGNIYPVFLMDKLIPYTSLDYYLHRTDLPTGSGGIAFLKVNDTLIAGEKFRYGLHYMSLYDDTQRSFGVWNMGIGAQISDPGASWTTSFEYMDSTRIVGNLNVGTNTDNILTGSSRGYGADLNLPLPATWVSVGNVRGSFDPSLSAFQIGALGVAIETNTYLALASNPEGQAKLQQLGIPAVEVGSVNLSGSWADSGNNSINVSMNNVKFFRSTTNPSEAPKIWATNSVGGTYSGNPINANVSLTNANNTSATVSAKFNLKTWDTGSNKWLATITDGSAQANALSNQHPAFTFKGAAAGNINPQGGTFTGTAAGIAK